jgi:hypothetical protein
MKDCPIHLTGHTTWVQKPPTQESGVKETVATFFSENVKGILSTPNHLSIDIGYQTATYVVVLDRTKGKHFAGSIRARDGADTWSGRCAGRLLETDNGFLFFGSWTDNIEGEISDTWWVEFEINNS